MSSSVYTTHHEEKLTWPEINDAAELGQVCVVPCGAVEQHGHHLPLEGDCVCCILFCAVADKVVCQTVFRLLRCLSINRNLD